MRTDRCSRTLRPCCPRTPTLVLPLEQSGLNSRQLLGRHSQVAPYLSRQIRCASESKTNTLRAESKLRKLKQKLKNAVASEDYGEAATLRDAIKELQEGDPVLRLRSELEEAITSQDFAPRVPITAPPPTTSDTVTNGVRVQVKSSFLPYRSNPGSYVFMYRVRISNETADKTVKLHSRHWIITDGNYHQDVVRGLGVIGEQPELQPGEEHVYGSFCPLRTPTGKMKGTFRMQVRTEQGQWANEFDADIGVFGLDMSDATPASW